MELDESLFWNVYVWARDIVNDKRQLHLRRAIIQRSITLVDHLDNHLQTSVKEFDKGMSDGNFEPPLNMFESASYILKRYTDLSELHQKRLQPLLDGLQPDQRNDPTRPEVILERQMELDQCKF